METNVSKPEFTVLDGLKKPFNFKEGANGMYLKKTSRYESGELFRYCITNFKKLRAKRDVHYRSTCDLVVHIGDGKPFIIENCNISSLLTYKILQNRDKYENVVFESYSTTPQYAVNPLRLVLCKDGTHCLYNVTEGGVENYTVIVPGGEEIVNQRFVQITRENYFRYHAAKQNPDAVKPVFKPAYWNESMNRYLPVPEMPETPSMASPAEGNPDLEIPYVSLEKAVQMRSHNLNQIDQIHFTKACQKWARDNFKAGDLIQSSWNSIVREECHVINSEAGRL